MIEQYLLTQADHESQHQIPENGKFSFSLTAMHFCKNTLENVSLHSQRKKSEKYKFYRVSSANLYLAMRITTVVKSVDKNDIVTVECSNILNSKGFIRGKCLFHSPNECFSLKREK